MRSSRPRAVLVAFTLSLATLAGCASEGEADPLSDPTSRESLRKAEPLATGCTYVKRYKSSYGTVTDVEVTPGCMMGTCSLPRPESDAMSDGAGGVFTSFTEYTDAVEFIGTCEDHEPITCEGRTGVDACESCVLESACSALILCEKDPNCLAIADCLQGCADDEACGARCLENGDELASANLVSLASVVTGVCEGRCR